MKRFLFIGVILSAILLYSPFTHAQAVKKAGTSTAAIEKLAQKRTQLLKDELFLSIDQTDKIMDINVDMLKKLDNINKQNLEKEARKKQVAQVEASTKNKIVSLLTPAQRQKFETDLFSQVYETKIDKKRAVSVKK